MTSDINLLAQVAYETGIDPITYATDHVIQSHVEIWLAVREFGVEMGVSDCTAVTSTAALSRRILGDLLDAGVDTTGGDLMTEDRPERPPRWTMLPGDPPALRAWLAEQAGDEVPEDWPQKESR